MEISIQYRRWMLVWMAGVNLRDWEIGMGLDWTRAPVYMLRVHLGPLTTGLDLAIRPR